MNVIQTVKLKNVQPQDVKSKVDAKKWLNGRLKVKNFNNDSSGKMVLPSPHSTAPNSPELFLLKYLP